MSIFLRVSPSEDSWVQKVLFGMMYVFCLSDWGLTQVERTAIQKRGPILTKFENGTYFVNIQGTSFSSTHYIFSIV